MEEDSRHRSVTLDLTHTHYTKIAKVQTGIYLYLSFNVEW